MLAQRLAVSDDHHWDRKRERQRLGRLRAELADSRRENRALWNQLSPPGRLPSCLGLSRNEGRLLAALLVNSALRKEALLFAMFSDVPEAQIPDIKSVDVAVCTLRKRLRPHGIKVMTPRCGEGYMMTAVDRARVAMLAHLETKAEATPRCAFVQFELQPLRGTARKKARSFEKMIPDNEATGII